MNWRSGTEPRIVREHLRAWRTVCLSGFENSFNPPDLRSSRVHADVATSAAQTVCLQIKLPGASTKTNQHPVPRHKIGIEFLQLLLGFQLVWTTGQQHIAVPRLIQPQALAEMLEGRPHSLPSFHFIERYEQIINI